MTAYDHILVGKAAGVATITLNRPDIRNAQDRFSLGELHEALKDAEADGTVAVVVLRAAGPAFCAGKNLKTGFGERGMEQLDGAGAQFTDVCNRIESMGKVVIAAVQGHAVTGGFLLACTADIVLAADDAKFSDTHAKWGLVPGAGESQRMPRSIGLAKARELFFTAEPMDALEAWRCGLVAKVVPRDRLDEEALAMAQRVARNSGTSIRAIKEMLNRGARADFETGMKVEAALVRGGMANWEPDADRDARLAAFKGGSH